MQTTCAEGIRKSQSACAHYECMSMARMWLVGLNRTCGCLIPHFLFLCAKSSIAANTELGSFSRAHRPSESGLYEAFVHELRPLLLALAIVETRFYQFGCCGPKSCRKALTGSVRSNSTAIGYSRLGAKEGCNSGRGRIATTRWSISRLQRPCDHRRTKL